MKKYCLDLIVKRVEHINEKYVLIVLTDEKELPEMCPGQFVELRVDGSKNTFLRRPISIHFVDRDANELHLLVAAIGDGTRQLSRLSEGDKLNTVLPLGNGFTQAKAGDKILLTGGGVGVAPLLLMGKEAKAAGAEVTFLLGARSAKDLLELDRFAEYGEVLVTTEDGSMGEKGFVTNHSILEKERFTRIQVCGPKPMMMAVAKYAKSVETDCEVSLENMMACGLGACLCCVEKTVKGNVCVCKEGPVFNINELNW